MVGAHFLWFLRGFSILSSAFSFDFFGSLSNLFDRSERKCKIPLYLIMCFFLFLSISRQIPLTRLRAPKIYYICLHFSSVAVAKFNLCTRKKYYSRYGQFCWCFFWAGIVFLGSLINISRDYGRALSFVYHIYCNCFVSTYQRYIIHVSSFCRQSRHKTRSKEVPTHYFS